MNFLLCQVVTGFGSRIESAKEKEKRERFAANALRSQSHSGSRRSKGVESSKEERPTSMAGAVAGGRGRAAGGRERASGAGVGAAAGGGGFKQLQAMAAKGGPKVVTYEEDGGGQTSAPFRSPDNSNNRNGEGNVNRKARVGLAGESREMRGASDFMYIEGSDVDRISEDQLDKLLGKARGAR